MAERGNTEDDRALSANGALDGEAMIRRSLREKRRSDFLRHDFTIVRVQNLGANVRGRLQPPSHLIK